MVYKATGQKRNAQVKVIRDKDSVEGLQIKGESTDAIPDSGPDSGSGQTNGHKMLTWPGW